MDSKWPKQAFDIGTNIEIIFQDYLTTMSRFLARAQGRKATLQ